MVKVPKDPSGIQRAAGYVRISALMGREQGADLLSDVIQKEKIEAWARYRGFTIVGWYVDLDVSGREGVRRPEFDRMMEDARAGKFEAVAVYRLTRFARSVKQAAEAYAELRRVGVELVSCTEDIDTTTASGKFMQNILFAMAEFESERISEEWRNVHVNRRRRGIAHAPTGVYGYRVEGAEIVAVEEAEAAAVRLIFEMRARGAGYGQIQNELERRGFRSPRGHSRFAKTTLLAMLRNPVYAGLVATDGGYVDATHPPIVTRETFEQAQRAGRRANTLARHTSQAMLAGLLVCHSCGYRLKFENDRSGTRARYRCPGRDLAEPCEHPVQIAARRAEAYVQEAFLRRFDPKRMPRNGKISRTRQQREWQRLAAKARARAAELERALDSIADQRFIKGTLEAEEYGRQFQRFAAEREQSIRDADEYERMADAVKPVERDVLALWPTLPAEVKRRTLSLQIERIVVLPYEGPAGVARIENIGKRLQIAWIQ